MISLETTNKEFFLHVLMNKLYHKKYMLWCFVGMFLNSILCYIVINNIFMLVPFVFMHGILFGQLMINAYLCIKFQNLENKIPKDKLEKIASLNSIWKCEKIEKLQKYALYVEKLLIRAQYDAMIQSKFFAEEDLTSWKKLHL